MRKPTLYVTVFTVDLNLAHARTEDSKLGSVLALVSDVDQKQN